MLTSLLERSPLLRGMLDFIYPPLCVGCGEFCEHPDSLCDHCLETIPWLDSPTYLTPLPLVFDLDEPVPPPLPVFAVGNYSGPLREAILRVKFHGATTPLPLLATRLVDKFTEDLSALRPTHLVPVPLHPSREYSRGFNQARLFAESLSRQLDFPVENGLLFRAKKRRPQSRLSEARRAANIRGVFEVDPPSALDANIARLILVDDVVTSGHTILEAERTLRRAGYNTVAVASIARTL